MEFKSHIVKSVFYAEKLNRSKLSSNYANIYYFNGEEKTFLFPLLANFLNKEITISMEYLTVQDSSDWGLGSCRMQRFNWCPCNHHEKPNLIFRLKETGVLRFDTLVGFFMERADGSTKELRLYMLVGHRSEIIVTNIKKDTKKIWDSFNKVMSKAEDLFGEASSMMDSVFKGEI